MPDTLELQQFEQVIRKFEPNNRLIRASALAGGVSAQVIALEIEQSDGQMKKLILRRHGEIDRSQNPQIATDEFRLLQKLQSVGLPVPKPYYLDPSNEILPTPYLVVEFIEGKTEFEPANLPDFIHQFAAQLARIHQLNSTDFSFLPKRDNLYAGQFDQRPVNIDESIDEGRIRAVLEAACPITPHNQPSLLHSDFWLGNILWQNDQLVGIVDWEDAALGDPLVDVAVTRLETLWALGSKAMERFTQEYQSINAIDLTNLPYWDLCAALRPAFKIDLWMPDPLKAQNMRDLHRVFITQAFEKLNVQP